MHPICNELSIIVHDSRRLAWGKNGEEGQDDLIHMLSMVYPRMQERTLIICLLVSEKIVAA